MFWSEGIYFFSVCLFVCLSFQNVIKVACLNLSLPLIFSLRYCTSHVVSCMPFLKLLLILWIQNNLIADIIWKIYTLILNWVFNMPKLEYSLNTKYYYLLYIYVCMRISYIYIYYCFLFRILISNIKNEKYRNNLFVKMNVLEWKNM